MRQIAAVLRRHLHLGLVGHKLLKNKKNLQQYTIGLIPHYMDKNSEWIRSIVKKWGSECLLIDVENTATNVIHEMNKCHIIISSSLHGIICADALEIPNIWCEISNKVVGGGFKFRDYNSSIDYEQKPYSTRDLGTLTRIERFISNKSKMKIQTKQIEIEDLMLSCIQQLLQKQKSL